MSKIIFILVFSMLSLSTVYAVEVEKTSSYEEIYPEIGYKTIEGALDDFEEYFGHKLKLPLRVPPISFTHHFGRFGNYLESEGDEHFEVTFINDQNSENHYKIDIRPIKYGIPIRKKYVIKTFELNNGNEATYMIISGFNVLVFERGNWQYSLNIDKRVSDKVTSEILVDIANSIDYPTEQK